MMERSFKFQVSGLRLAEGRPFASGPRLFRGLFNLKHETRNPKRAGSARAFNLVELMFSILILGVGLVAVASLFPVATALQQETMDDVMMQQVARNARTLLQRRGIDRATFEANALAQNGKATGEVFKINDLWPMEDRSFPTTEPVNERDYYWVPLFRYDSNGDPAQNLDWNVYVLILKVVPGYGPSDDNVVRTGRANAGDYVIDGRSDQVRAAANQSDQPRVFPLQVDVETAPYDPFWHGVVAGTTSTSRGFTYLPGGIVR